MSIPNHLRTTVQEQDTQGRTRRLIRYWSALPIRDVSEHINILAGGKVNNATQLFENWNDEMRHRNLRLIVINETASNVSITITARINEAGENSTPRSCATLLVNANSTNSVSIPVGYDDYTATANANTTLFWRIIGF